MRSFSLAAGILLCNLAVAALANDTLYIEPSTGADAYYAHGDAQFGGLYNAGYAGDYHYGTHYGAGGCSSCGGSGCTWGCCERPCSRNLHLWDGYCEEKNYSSWSFNHGYNGCRNGCGRGCSFGH